MSNYRKHIDDFFREKLGNYRETPPAEAWGELEERLDGLTPAVPGAPYRWMWHAAIISMLVVLGVSAGRNLMNSSFPEKRTLALNGKADGLSAAGTAPVNTTSNGVAPNSSATVAPETPTTTSTPDGNKNTGAAAIVPGGTFGKKSVIAKHKVPAQSIAARLTGSNRREAKRTNGRGNNSDIAVNKESNTNNEANMTSPDLALSPKSQEETVLPDNTKKDNTSTPTKKQESQKPVGTRQKAVTAAGFRRFEAGVKAGFETGFSADAGNKLVVSPYLQYNLSSKFALMVQPAAKFAQSGTHSLNDAQSYVKDNNDGNLQSFIEADPSIVGGKLDTIGWKSHYTYTRSHDSIVKSHTYGGSYTELELPILIKYIISSKVSAYGGVNVIYSKMTSIRENTVTTKIVDTAFLGSEQNYIYTKNYPTTSPDLSVTVTGNDIKNYKNPYSTDQNQQVRLGYMLGVSYQCTKKIMLDALVQQTPVNTIQVGGNNVNTAQSATYFRLSVGYKITK